MTIAQCSENSENQPEYDLTLWCFNGVPEINLSIPSDAWPDDYDGAGTFFVSLRDILQETLDDSPYMDECEGNQAIAELLREYADKLEKRALDYRNSIKITES
jgi:hypothetical protein